MHHRRAPSMDGRDDLLDVDPLEISSGRREVRVAELALDQRQRDSLVQQLDRVPMAQLVFVPTSAKASLGRPAQYADRGEKRLLRAVRGSGLSA